MKILHQKAYKTILYTFLSPYLYLLKEQSLNPEDIPNFLVIGGRAKSGKTNLLKYLVRLVNQNDKFFGFKEFDGNGNNPQRKIGEVLNAENSYQFFVDEVKQKFFMNDSGETLVKNVANEKRNHQPSMILTTNAHNNSYSSQVSRRIYYIEFNNAFPEDEKIAKCNLVYLDLLKNANDNLFVDEIKNTIKKELKISFDNKKIKKYTLQIDNLHSDSLHIDLIYQNEKYLIRKIPITINEFRCKIFDENYNLLYEEFDPDDETKKYSLDGYKYPKEECNYKKKLHSNEFICLFERINFLDNLGYSGIKTRINNDFTEYPELK